MIEKFISMKNVGRFRDCSPCGDVSFRKLTLLFAENGRGKTTLCAILRSLQGGQPEYIAERKTLGISDPPFVQIRLGGNTRTFRTNDWSSIHSDIAIFDSVFLHDTITRGEVMELCRLSGPQAYHLLNRLQKQGKIRINGEKRHAFYTQEM